MEKLSKENSFLIFATANGESGNRGRGFGHILGYSYGSSSGYGYGFSGGYGNDSENRDDYGWI